MKKLCYLLTLCALTCGWNSHLFAQNEPSSEEMEKAWALSMTPGAEQAWLAEMAGEWETKSTLWMEPGAPPTTSEGSSSMEMILGGRYIRENHKGMSWGMPHHGESTMGHNNLDGKYYMTWVDNMGTGIMTGSGERTGNIVNIHCTYPKMTGEGVDHFRFTTEILSKDKHTMTMYMVNDSGEEVKQMEIVYTRK